jgi:hypothetical protein
MIHGGNHNDSIYDYLICQSLVPVEASGAMSEARGAFQGTCCLTMALRMPSSLWAQAIKATFLAFPALSSF